MDHHSSQRNKDGFKDERSLVNRSIKKLFSLYYEENIHSSRQLLHFSNKELIRRSFQLILKRHSSFLIKSIPADEKDVENLAVKVTKDNVSFIPYDGKRIKISSGVVFRVLKENLKFPVYIFLICFKQMFKFVTEKPQPHTIALSFGLKSFISDNVEKRFSDFCESSEIDCLGSDKIIVVNDANDFQSSEKIIFTPKYPLFYLLDKTPVSLRDFLRVVYDIISVNISLVFMAFHNPVVFLAYKDLSLFPLVKLLNEKGMIGEVITTNSSFFDQESCFLELPERKFKLSMVWYSGDLGWYDYDTNTFFEDNPEIFSLRADNHYVWTALQKKRFEQECIFPQDIKVCGPMMFYLESKEFEKNSDEKVITIFDTVPYNEEFFYEIYSDRIYYYNQFENLEMFMCDIISTIEHINQESENSNLKVKIKTKRVRLPHHDKRYFDLLSKLEEKDFVELVDPNENVFDLIKQSEMVASVPPGSPTYIGKHYKKNSFYYDPISILKRDKENLFKGINLVKGTEELKDYLFSNLS